MSSRSIDAARLARLRAAAQLLHRPRGGPTHPADIARTIGGTQAQEHPSGLLAFRSRNARITAADVERARTEERSIVRLWVMRNTVHLVATDDLEWMRPLFGPMMEAFNRRRLAHFGIDANAQDRALSLISNDLQREGPLSRTELSARLERADLRVDASVRVHIFPLAVSTGIAHLGPIEKGAVNLIAANDWLPETKQLPREAALAQAARSYLNAFAPATEADFAGWSGLSLTDCRAGLSAIASAIREVRVGELRMLAPKGRRLSAPKPPLLRLLPNFDTYLMGHRDRGFIAPPDRWKRIAPGGGVLRATITLDGTAVGTWKLRRRAGKLAAELDPFEPLDRGTRQLIDAELDDIARFEGQQIA